MGSGTQTLSTSLQNVMGMHRVAVPKVWVPVLQVDVSCQANAEPKLWVLVFKLYVIGYLYG